MRAALAFFAVLCGPLCGATYRSPDGAFTLETPPQWRIAQDTEEPYPVILGPESDADAPIIVITAHAARSLPQFADESLRDIGAARAYTLVRRDGFLTDARKTGLKAVASARESGEDYAQVFYFLQGDGRIYTLMATLPASALGAYERTLDALAKSFLLAGEAPLWQRQLRAAAPVRKAQPPRAAAPEPPKTPAKPRASTAVKKRPYRF